MTFVYDPQSLGTVSLTDDVWADIDFSSAFPGGVPEEALVFFAARYTYHTIFRTKGDATVPVHQASDYGETGVQAARLEESSSQYWQMIACPCDANGIIEAKALITRDIYIYYIGHDTEWTTLLPSTLISSGALPMGWTDVNISAVVGAYQSLAIMHYKYNADPGVNAVGAYLRTNGETDSSRDPGGLGAKSYHGASMFCAENYGAYVNGMFCSPAVITDDAGKYEHIAPDIALDMDVSVAGYMPVYGYPVVVQASTTKATGSWHELDLSPWIGTRPAFVVLKVQNTEVGGGANHISFRPKDIGLDTYSITPGYADCGCSTLETDTQNDFQTVLCPTNDDGAIEYRVSQARAFEITMLVFGPSIALAPPVVVSKYPSGVMTEDVDHVEVVINGDYPLDSSTLNLTMTSPTGVVYDAVTAGVVDAGFTGSVTDLSTRLIITLTDWPDGVLVDGQVWSFSCECEDVWGGAL